MPRSSSRCCSIAASGETLAGEERDATVGQAIARAGFGFLLLDGDGRVLVANRPACELLGWEASMLVGRDVAELVHADDRGWSQAELELLFTGAADRVRQEVRLLTVSGDEVEVELTARPADGERSSRVRVVVMLEATSDRVRRERELRRLADTDPLSGLYNRRRFAVELDRQLSVAQRYGRGGAVLMLDIDGLKRINDTHGHDAGDQAIVTAASVLRANLRASDVIARIGGDEFAVLLPDGGTHEAVPVAQALLDAADGTNVDDCPWRLVFSIGIAAVTVGRDEAASLLKRADAALYAAKRGGGNRYAIADDHAGLRADGSVISQARGKAHPLIGAQTPMSAA